MSTSVMGLPLASGQRGVPLTSRVLVRTAGKSLPSLPLCVRVAFVGDACCCKRGAVEEDRGCCSVLIGVPAFAVLESEEASCFLGCALLGCQKDAKTRYSQRRDLATYAGVDDFAPSGFSSVNWTSYNNDQFVYAYAIILMYPYIVRLFLLLIVHVNLVLCFDRLCWLLLLRIVPCTTIKIVVFVHSHVSVCMS